MPNVTAKVTNGNTQAIQLPQEFKLDTDEVFISRSGDKLILTPRKNSWQGFTEGLNGFSEDFQIADDLSEDAPRKHLE